MYPPLTYAVAAFLGLVAVLALVALKQPSLEPFVRRAMRAAHAATAAVVALDAIKLMQGHEVDNMVTHVGYMVASVGLPVILLSQRGEFDEEGNAVLDDEGNPVDSPPPHLAVVAICATAMLVLVVRLQLTL
ncbi:hypothetical protein [Nocardioides daphniae]|uniref:Uncharacterized protein n=1 Tax=Nocardioides daphniae TaxID=402297 RepID=A0A4P7U9D4_9ACTN|nr:hypothetical protein [Nocardioides daphniae]QCC76670.1 hypothetical protein E2C04_04575 [Nocardioides daphniae]GGD15193.1 hypothetical protein GCM10007231_12740 [Nocardioides daphniae]